MKAREIRFGRNVKALRELHHVTQSQLAEAIHISRQGLSGWEKGEGKPDIYYLDSICEFLAFLQMMFCMEISFPKKNTELLKHLR